MDVSVRDKVTDLKLLQRQNTLVPMELTESPITTDVKSLHWMKEYGPLMDVTVSGITSVVRSLHGKHEIFASVIVVGPVDGRRQTQSKAKTTRKGALLN